MQFPYKHYGDDVFRPVIPIVIRHRNEAIRYEVLVDSGADVNVVPAELGEAIGLRIEAGNKRSVRGVTGAGIYYVHPVSISIGGWAYNVDVGFMPDMGADSYGIVGQRGFFEFFKVIFDAKNAQLELKPHHTR